MRQMWSDILLMLIQMGRETRRKLSQRGVIKLSNHPSRRSEKDKKAPHKNNYKVYFSDDLLLFTQIGSGLEENVRSYGHCTVHCIAVSIYCVQCVFC